MQQGPTSIVCPALKNKSSLEGTKKSKKEESTDESMLLLCNIQYSVMFLILTVETEKT